MSISAIHAWLRIKISYWDMTGRAEAVRLALAVGGIDFEDERVSMDEFKKRKTGGELVFGSFPVMHVDGVQFAQADAMLRYAGKLAGIYPDDAVKALKVDMVMGGIEDALVAAFKENSKEYRKKFAEEHIKRYFGPIEKIYSEAEGPFLLGGDIGIADLKIYFFCNMMKSGVVSHVPTDVMEQFENIQKCRNAVAKHEKVAAWNAAHQGCTGIVD